MLKIVICEDEEAILNSYSSIIENIIENKKLNAKLVLNALNTNQVDAYLENNCANVFLLDIDLKTSENGYDYAIKLREKYKKAYIVFISGHSEYVFSSFNVRPFNFITKPVKNETIEKNILEIYNDYVFENFPNLDENYFEVKTAGLLRKIKIQDVILIERNGPKTTLHVNNGQIQLYEPLEFLEEKFSKHGFIRCHKSYICNLNKIKEINTKKNEINLDNELICFIGRKFKKELLAVAQFGSRK